MNTQRTRWPLVAVMLLAAAALQAEEPEPALSISFDSEDYAEQLNVGRGEHNSITTDPAGGGRQVLRVGVPEGSHYGASMHAPMAALMDDEPEEATARYWIYVPEHFAFPQGAGGGKLPGFAGRYGEAGWGGRRADGTNGWSARMGFEPPRRFDLEGRMALSFYTYHADMGRWGAIDGWSEALGAGEWRQIDQYVRMNTPGEHDGVQRGWVDGELVFEREDRMFRAEGHDDVLVEEFWFNIYYGGSWTSPVDTALYFRDLKIWPGEEVVPTHRE